MSKPLRRSELIHQRHETLTVLAGLDELETKPPLFQLESGRWFSTLDRVRGFARDWDGAARTAGWDDLSLYGLHPYAPYANLACMGAAFLITLSASKVIFLDCAMIKTKSATGSTLVVYRSSPPPAAAVPWFR